MFYPGVAVARIYINSFTEEAFTYLFDTCFSSVKQVTAKSVHHPKGNSLLNDSEWDIRF